MNTELRNQREAPPGALLRVAPLTAACAAVFMGMTPATAATPASTPAPPPSAIGQAFVPWIAVSPDMQRTGLVVAMSSDKSNALWASHDGGASWHKVPATGWNGGRPVIATDRRGHDTLYALDKSGLQRSDDGGVSWRPFSAGPGGLPAPLPAYADDGSIAVAGGSSDYVVRASGTEQKVPGSGGGVSDFSFAPSPSFPSGGRHYAALLSSVGSNGAPVILHCDSTLRCSGSTNLPGASGMGAAPAALLLSTNYAQDGVVFAQSGKGIYKSVDGGATFAPLPIIPSDGAAATTTPMMVLAPGYREGGPVRTAYVSLFQIFTDPHNPHSLGGVYRSDDGGATWRPTGSPSPLDQGSIALAIAGDGRLFAAYMGTSSASGASVGLLCSPDGGANWRAACPPEGSAANDPGPLATTTARGVSPEAAGAGGGSPSTSAVDRGASVAGGGPGGSGGRSESGGAVAAASGTAAARGTTSDRRWLFLVLAGALAAAAAAQSLWKRRAARPSTSM